MDNQLSKHFKSGKSLFVCEIFKRITSAYPSRVCSNELVGYQMSTEEDSSLIAAEHVTHFPHNEHMKALPTSASLYRHLFDGALRRAGIGSIEVRLR